MDRTEDFSTASQIHRSSQSGWDRIRDWCSDNAPHLIYYIVTVVLGSPLSSLTSSSQLCGVPEHGSVWTSSVNFSIAYQESAIKENPIGSAMHLTEVKLDSLKFVLPDLSVLYGDAQDEMTDLKRKAADLEKQIHESVIIK